MKSTVNTATAATAATAVTGLNWKLDIIGANRKIKQERKTFGHALSEIELLIAKGEALHPVIVATVKAARAEKIAYDTLKGSVKLSKLGACSPWAIFVAIYKAASTEAIERAKAAKAAKAALVEAAKAANIKTQSEVRAAKDANIAKAAKAAKARSANAK